MHVHSLPSVSAMLPQGEIEDLIPVNSSLVLRKLIVCHSLMRMRLGCLLCRTTHPHLRSHAALPKLCLMEHTSTAVIRNTTPAASGDSLARTLASFPPGVQEALYGSTEALRALAAFNLCECRKSVAAAPAAAAAAC